MSILIALAGQPNCGKTTLFNRLTGSAQHVGNWAGVTVEVKTGRLLSRYRADALIADLPGVYSLAPRSQDEKAARDFIHTRRPDVLLSIVDATALERSLPLVMQLRALGTPMVLALNMMDELRAQGGRIDVSRLESLLGIPVVPICARNGSGTDALVRRVIAAAHSPIAPMSTLSAEQIARRCCSGRLDDALTHTLDAVFLHPVFSLPLLGLMIFGMFFIAFGPVGNGLCNLFAQGCHRLMALLSAWLIRLGVADPLLGLMTEGALGGAVSVLTFLPMILLLFGQLSLLEDSGVMARMAFALDRPLSRIGLDGRCFLPLMLGFGCSVPSVMCARAIPDERQRRLTVRLAPFLSCSAKAPVYALFAQVFFKEHRLTTLCAAYALGMAAALLTGLAARPADDSSADFVLELPRYRLPTLRNTGRLMLEKAADFIRRAFGVICLSSAVIWFLCAFNPALAPAASLEESLLGRLSLSIAPLFLPAGFGSPQAAAAVLAGLIAKENVISTLHVLTAGDIASAFSTPLCAAAFLAFFVLYSPCSAALSAMRRELGAWRAVWYALLQTILAWGMAVCIFQLGRLIGL